MKIWHSNACLLRKILGLGLLVAALILGWGPGKPGAQTEIGGNAGKKINVSADELIVDRNANTAEFVGNVRVTRSDGQLSADRLVIYYRNVPDKPPAKNLKGDLNSGIDKMVAEGHVRIETPQIAAEADKAVYRQSNRTIVLSGANASISSGNNSVAGSSITLYIEEESISVVGDARRRVEAILTPEQRH